MIGESIIYAAELLLILSVVGFMARNRALARQKAVARSGLIKGIGRAGK